MALLVRKIEKAKWMQNNILAGEDVSADAITNCTKTVNNALSAWQIGEESLVTDAVVAMASQFQHLDAIDVVLLSQPALADAGLKVEHNPGRTALRDFRDRHHDVVGLTYRTLGVLASLIVNGIRESRIRRFTKGELRRLLKNAVDSRRIDVQDLHEGVRKSIADS